MNRYHITFETSDHRVFEVYVKAEGMDEKGELIRFWRKGGPFRLFKIILHYVHKDVVVAVISEGNVNHV